MVDQEEYEQARGLLAAALEKEYADYLIPPVELVPGYWVAWPDRIVRINLEETQQWIHGVASGGTGNLQAHISYPSDQHRRIRPTPANARFTEKTAKRAAQAARKDSDFWASHYKLDYPPAQGAWLEGYKAVTEASHAKVASLWKVREPSLTDQPESWRRLHEVVESFLKIGGGIPGVLDWRPDDVPIDPRWEFYRDALTPNGAYARGSNGAIAAIDDWALANGLKAIRRH